MIQPKKINQLLKMDLHLLQNENQKLETVCKNLSGTKTNIKRTSDHIPNVRDALNSLLTKIRSN